MGQDVRAPFYGANAPNTVRDTMDLQEAYIELFGRHKTGFGATFGREMLTYGESRLIGSPQWSNVSRTFDNARVYYRTGWARLEVLMVSPVKVLPDQFNKPELGERIVGTYDTFSNVWHGASFDAYVLDHSQNKIGGWTGAGTLGTQSYGGRVYGPLPGKFAYNLEGVGQTGHMGLLTQRAYAWFAGGSRKVTVGRLPLNFSAEYKLASGTRLGQTTSATFDQLSPSNHDKFGHEDLFGWRNLKTLKSLETLSLTKSVALNVMYTDDWLFSRSDALYNSSGSSIADVEEGDRRDSGRTGAGRLCDLHPRRASVGRRFRPFLQRRIHRGDDAQYQPEILLRISAVLVQVRRERNEDTNLHHRDQAVRLVRIDVRTGVGPGRHLHRIGAAIGPAVGRRAPCLRQEAQDRLSGGTIHHGNAGLAARGNVVLRDARSRRGGSDTRRYTPIREQRSTNCFRSCGRCSLRKTSGARWRRSRRTGGSGDPASKSFCNSAKRAISRKRTSFATRTK